MGNLRQWAEELAGDEPILAVVTNGEFTHLPAGKVFQWDAVKTRLGEDFDDGYGGHNCDGIWAYTPMRVIAIGVYDGATWPYAIPRNPTEGITPTIEGGE